MPFAKIIIDDIDKDSKDSLVVNDSKINDNQEIDALSNMPIRNNSLLEEQNHIENTDKKNIDTRKGVNLRNRSKRNDEDLKSKVPEGGKWWKNVVVKEVVHIYPNQKQKKII